MLDQSVVSHSFNRRIRLSDAKKQLFVLAFRASISKFVILRPVLRRSVCQPVLALRHWPKFSKSLLKELL
jgi:hypothetical protein